ncbi:MAG: hypothetical protein M1484_00040 [Patescibacteria group bacterium]|nr:hypothetical protein [Patescibacteria group bacterium]MCL5431470.1 hypothetical protein [Patescibacteria group bacterium]
MDKNKPRLDSENLRARLKLRSFESEKKLLVSHPTAAEFFGHLKLRPGKIRQHAARLLTSGALAGSLLLTAHTGLPTQANTTIAANNLTWQNILPPEGQWSLSPDQEQEISQKIKAAFGVNAVPELDGNRLPHDYGRMGAEQHLARFPGDNVPNMAPGLGGWGYVTDPTVEKYYVAVPIIYLPDWRERTKYYVDWYRWRRMVVVNPANGKAIVSAVADAGPADWTGKHFGGSPEVLEYLGINTGMQNHPVVMFFLDDPNNEVPLGPLEYNIEVNKELTAKQA